MRCSGMVGAPGGCGWSERLGAVHHRTAPVRRRVAREPDVRSTAAGARPLAARAAGSTRASAARRASGRCRAHRRRRATGSPPSRDAIPPSCTNRCASPDGAVAERLEPEVDERREAVVELRHVDVVRPTARSAPRVRAHDLRRLSMMSSSGQCVRQPVPRPGAPARSPRRTRVGFGRSRARSAVVKTNAATPSTGMSQSSMQIGSAMHPRVEVVVDGDRPVVPVRPRDPRAVLAQLDDDVSPSPHGSRRSAAGTRCTAARSSTAVPRTPTARSTGRRRPPRSSGSRGSGRAAGCASARCTSTSSAAPARDRVDRAGSRSRESARSPGTRRTTAAGRPRCSASQFGVTIDDAVDRRLPARRREDRAGRESVDSVTSRGRRRRCAARAVSTAIAPSGRSAWRTIGLCA